MLRGLVIPSVVHEPARAESRPGLKRTRLEAPPESRTRVQFAPGIGSARASSSSQENRADSSGLERNRADSSGIERTRADSSRQEPRVRSILLDSARFCSILLDSARFRLSPLALPIVDLFAMFVSRGLKPQLSNIYSFTFFQLFGAG